MTIKAFCRITVSVLVLITGFCHNIYSQKRSIADKENQLVILYSKLVSFIPSNYDSISFYSTKFETDLKELVQTNPSTLNYDFQKLVDSNFCHVNTSVDGNFRIYSWDTWTGGTMHVFKKIYQWKSNGQVYMEAAKYNEGDAGSYCSRIFTVHINRKAFYLSVSNGIFSTRDAVQSVSVYNIVGNELTDTVKLFKTKTKNLNRIDVEYNFFSVVDRPERPVELITYDEKKKIIYIPVVDSKGQVTNKHILYQLKEICFEYTGIITAKRK